MHSTLHLAIDHFEGMWLWTSMGGVIHWIGVTRFLQPGIKLKVQHTREEEMQALNQRLECAWEALDDVKLMLRCEARKQKKAERANQTATDGTSAPAQADSPSA